MKKSTVLRTGLALALVGSSYVAISEKGLDIFGDPKRPKTEQEVNDEINAKVNKAYDSSSLVGRYSLQYINGLTIEMYKNTGGNGILGFLDVSNFVRKEIGQTCLHGTSYDTTASQITGRYVQGEINAVATLNIDENNTVVVFPAASEAQPLRFSQSENLSLIPADDFTDSTLQAYGCNITESLYTAQ